MKRISTYSKNKISRNESYEAKSIEKQLQAVMAGEQIEMGGRQLIYTERAEGVKPETNIRSDRFKIAQDATEYVNKTNIAKREAFDKAKEGTKRETSAGESTQGTGGTKESK